MRDVAPPDTDAPLQLGCRAQAIYVLAFVLLFIATCWLIGSAVASPR
jgi:hypothetical protein